MTANTGKLVEDLNHLSSEIEPRLDLVSAAARTAWRETRSRIPTTGELESGVIRLSDEELGVIQAKVHRFREILFAMAVDELRRAAQSPTRRK